MNPAKHGSPHAPASSHHPHLIPPEILKKLKFKQWSHDQHHTHFTGGGGVNPGVALTTVDAFAKFKERGFIPKNTT